MQKKSKLEKEIHQNISVAIQELVAAAACYGAVHHKLYSDKRVKLIRKRALARVLKASKDYHGVLTAALFLS